MDNASAVLPDVSGISPSEGPLGTKITIRGHNLGKDATDLLGVIVCDHDCTRSAKWVNPSKIICIVHSLTLDQGVSGPVKVTTSSGGEGVSQINFTITFNKLSPLTQSSVWLEEDYRGIVPDHMGVLDIDVKEVVYEADPLGILSASTFSTGPPIQDENYAQFSSKLSDDSFHPIKFLLDRHSNTPYDKIKKGFEDLKAALNCAPGSEIKSSDLIATRDVPIVVTVMADLNKLSKVTVSKEYKNKQELGRRIQNLSSKIWTFFTKLVAIYSHRLALTEFLALYNLKINMFMVPKTISTSQMYKSAHFHSLNVCADYKSMVINKSTYLDRFIQSVNERVDIFVNNIIQDMDTMFPIGYDLMLDVYKKIHKINKSMDFMGLFIKRHYTWLENQLKLSKTSFTDVLNCDYLSTADHRSERGEFCRISNKYILELCGFVKVEVSMLLRFISYILKNFENLYGEQLEVSVMNQLVNINGHLLDYLKLFILTIQDILSYKFYRFSSDKNHFKNTNFVVEPLDEDPKLRYLCCLTLFDLKQIGSVFLAVDRVCKTFNSINLNSFKPNVLKENPFSFQENIPNYVSSFLVEALGIIEKYYTLSISTIIFSVRESQIISYAKPLYCEISLEVYSMIFELLLIFRCVSTNFTSIELPENLTKMVSRGVLVKALKKATVSCLKDEKNINSHQLISFLSTFYSVIQFLKSKLPESDVFKYNWNKSSKFSPEILQKTLSQDLEEAEIFFLCNALPDVCQLILTDLFLKIHCHYFSPISMSPWKFYDEFIEFILLIKKICTMLHSDIYRLLVIGVYSKLAEFIKSNINTQNFVFHEQFFQSIYVIKVFSDMTMMKSDNYNQVIDEYINQFNCKTIDTSKICKKRNDLINLLKLTNM